MNVDAPKYLKLARTFESQLRSGALRVGDRLPSVRRLREERRVSVATVVGCYEWLERHGYVRARPKSGFYVSGTPTDDRQAPAIATVARRPTVVRARDFAIAHPDEDAIDLGVAVVAPELLPRSRLNRSVRLALSAFDDVAVRYEDPRGNARLRRQIARLVARQGANCSPDEVIVTSGGTEALNLAIRVVARPGDVVAVESPGCYEVLLALASFGIRAVEIPHVHGGGIDLDRLASAAKGDEVKAVLVDGACHIPLGDCADDRAKAALVAFATDRRIPIVEGDTFGELVFNGERPPTLKSFDTDGIVLQYSSLAHYLAPGFNVGWLVTERWQSDIERVKSFTNVAGARLPQLALAEFLESGAFDRHVKQLRRSLFQSVTAARRAVLATFPAGTRVSNPDGGFVLWIQLPDRFDGADVQRRAAAAGVHVLRGTLFSPNRRYRSCIRIACGYPPAVLERAIETLARVLAG